MITCAGCGRAFPEVVGADAQVCPHCGHETGGFAPAPDASARRVDPAAAVGEAFRLYRRSWGRLALVWAPAVVAEVLVILAVWAYARSLGLPADPLEASAGDQLRFLGVAAPLYLGLFVLKLALWGPVAAVALGRPARATPSGPMLLLGAVLGLLYLAGLMLLVVPFLVFYHWFLYAPAARIAGAPTTGAALEASRAFARRARTFGFTAVVLFVWLGTLIVATGVSAAVGAWGPALGLAHPLAAEIAVPLGAWLVAPLVPLLPAAYWAIASDAAPAPVDPHAPNAARFRTTKCPQCGTLIPYTATGEPVEVSCPSCGRSGRVL